MRLPAIHSTFQAYKVVQHLLALQAGPSGTPSARLLILPDEEAGEALLSDIEALRSVLNWNGEATLCPAWAHSPYSGLRPSLRVRHLRLRAMGVFEKGTGLVVATLSAMLQPTIPQTLFKAHGVTFRTGEFFGTRDEVRTKLLAAGYREVMLVEDPGDFAIRGEILDLFSVAFDEPLRIEWFDTHVERIRHFDSETQRTLSGTDQKSVHVPPAREILPSTASLLRERVKEHADSAGIPKQVRDPLIQPLQSGTFPENSETWAAWAYPQTSRFLDWWDSKQVLWVDRDSCIDEWNKESDEWRNQYVRKQEKVGNDREVFCPPEALLPDSTLSALSSLGEPVLEFVSLASPPQVEDVTHEVPGHWKIERLAEKIGDWSRSGVRVRIGSRNKSQASRLRYLLDQRNVLPGGYEILGSELQHSLVLPSEGLALIAESTVLGGPKRKPALKTRTQGWSGLQALSDLSVNDVVVHRTHGLGQYRGLSRISLAGLESEFLILEYAKGDKLYVPIYRLDEIQKYAAGKSSTVLDRLGTPQFQKAKERARESAKKLAFDLIQLHAKRALRPSLHLPPPGALYHEFAARFPFEETEDQAAAIQGVLKDLESDRPMDRLVCGDVGFGKTEIAMRAAFRCVEHGLQVVVLVPTTLLAYQHEETFRKRFEGTSVVIAGLSRLKNRGEQKETLAKVKSGAVDILIGTHRALSKDVEWKKLGLIVVDEEHRFGVEHKEKLKTLALEAHMLTLTATPIPRTLHMAMAGIRDLSVIATPPVDRLPIKTLLSSSDDDVIQQAIEQELARDGQVFFLHNRVDTLHRVAQRVRELVPRALVSMAHGQMSETELESRMMEFYSGQTQVLVCTTIIESGLDLPRANTLLVDNAENLGLAQLYQLRGRVGRSDRRAYCYLLVGAKKDLTREAKERLEVIQRFVELGSGFAIATHDLELRGGGNLLGPEQSGHVAEIGLDLYMELLEEAVRELRDLPPADTAPVAEPELKLLVPAYLDESYVPDIHQRLALYRRLSGAKDETEVHQLEAELTERFGPLPAPAENLLWTIRLKILARKVGVESITSGRERTSLQLSKSCVLSPQKLVGLVLSDTKRYQLTSESKLVVGAMPAGPRELFLDLESLFNRCYPN